MRCPVYNRYVILERSECNIGDAETGLCVYLQTPTLEAVMSVFPSSLKLHSLAYGMVVRRLIEERQFWAHAALMELVKCGSVAGK